MGNISGTGAGMNLIFGIDWKIGSVIMIAVVVYMYFAKNVYSKVEKIITLCIVLMIVAFYATLVGVGGRNLRGLPKDCSALRSLKAPSARHWLSFPPMPL